MTKRLLAVWCGLLLVGSIGCVESVDDDIPDDDATGMHLGIVAPNISDVTHMEYTVYRVPALSDGTCPTNLKKPPEGSEKLEGFPKQKPMKENMTLPIDDIVEASPFKEGSEHRFADLLHYTDAGCYFVYIQPERTIENTENEVKKAASKDCLPTYGTIEVTSGDEKKKTKKDGYIKRSKNGFTERVFISQCPGLQQDQGVMDLIAALNAPPNIDDVALIDQKFVPCTFDGESQQVTLCASASDPDNDPLEFTWSVLIEGYYGTIKVDLDASVEGIEDVEFLGEYEGYDDCVKVTFDSDLESASKFVFKVTVRDLLWSEDEQITFEQWFKDRNIKQKKTYYGYDVYVPIRSRDSQVLKTYVDHCDDEPLWLQSFEEDTEGWLDFGEGTIHRTASGETTFGYADGIASSTGEWYARLQTSAATGCLNPGPGTTCGGPFTRFGGPYEGTSAADGWVTSVDIYLDMDYAAANPDRRFDWSVAVNQADPETDHLRDFVFNVGTVDDNGVGKFSISPSNNASRANSNPYDADAELIDASGWYTFQHTFSEEGGFLLVDLEILDANDDVVHSWQIGGLGGPDAVEDVGRIRYGWFANQEIHNLAIDNTRIRIIL